MSLCNRRDLPKRAAYSDLAEALAPDHLEVDGELLALFLDPDADTSAYTGEVLGWAQLAADRMLQAINDASAEVMSYLARYGEIDESNAPDILSTRCLDIALYRIFGGDAQSEYAMLYRKACAWLEQVAEGTVPLDLSGSGEAATAGPAFSAPEAVFTRDSLGAFIDDRGHGNGFHRGF